MNNQTPSCNPGIEHHEYRFGRYMPYTRPLAYPSQTPVSYDPDPGYQELHGCIHCGHQKYVKITS